ncbi:hypothetical protein JW905_08385, partial [bacterium]|nr:hypothetical protein [candidate division CSSED10-310 bacterium]
MRRPRKIGGQRSAPWRYRRYLGLGAAAAGAVCFLMLLGLIYTLNPHLIHLTLLPETDLAMRAYLLLWIAVIIGLFGTAASLLGIRFILRERRRRLEDRTRSLRAELLTKAENSALVQDYRQYGKTHARMVRIVQADVPELLELHGTAAPEVNERIRSLERLCELQPLRWSNQVRLFEELVAVGMRERATTVIERLLAATRGHDEIPRRCVRVCISHAWWEMAVALRKRLYDDALDAGSR